MKRIEKFKECRIHRKEVQRIAKEHGYSFPFHDFIKMINILLLGDRVATKLHRKFSRHHAHLEEYPFYWTYNDDGMLCPIYRKKRVIRNKVEAVIDWESARFTKPDKPLNAYETWKEYYSDIDMEDTLKELGFWVE